METILLDACLAITFGNARRLDLITGLRSHRIAIASRALAEVVKPPARQEIERAVHSGAISVEEVELSKPDEQEALARFDAMPAFRGRGDAEVLALATARGYLVATDERAIRRMVRDEFGASHLVSTLDFLVLAVREARLSAKEAEELLARLDIGSYYQRRLAEAGLKFEDTI